MAYVAQYWEEIVPRVRKEVELAVRLGDKRGGLGEILEVVAASDVNVLAYCTYTDRTDSVVLLISDDPHNAKRCLEAAEFECKANSVIVVSAPDQVGAAARIGAHLGRAGIEILYSYASAIAGGEFFAVFKTSNDDLALGALAEGSALNDRQAA